MGLDVIAGMGIVIWHSGLVLALVLLVFSARLILGALISVASGRRQVGL